MLMLITMIAASGSSFGPFSQYLFSPGRESYCAPHRRGKHGTKSETKASEICLHYDCAEF